MTRQQTRFVSSKNLQTCLGPKVRNFFARFGKKTNLDEPHKKLPRVLSILSISPNPVKIPVVFCLCFIVPSLHSHCLPLVSLLQYDMTKKFLPQGMLSTALILMDPSTYWPSSSSPNGGNDRGEQEHDVNLRWNVCWTRVKTKRLAFVKIGQEHNKHVKSGSLLQCLTIWVMSCLWIPSVPLGISRIAHIQSYHADISSTFFAVDSDYRTRSSWNLLNSAMKATCLSTGQVGLNNF